MFAWQRRKAVIVGVAALAIVATGLFVGIRPNRSPARPATVAAAITIDPNIGETFAPAPKDAAPELTAQQAFARHRQLNGRGAIPIPEGVTVELGLLTILAGPTNPHTGTVVTRDGVAYAALNELAWGYRWHWCPMSRNPAAPGRVRCACTRWNFLNANTGREIDETWQVGNLAGQSCAESHLIAPTSN